MHIPVCLPSPGSECRAGVPDADHDNLMEKADTPVRPIRAGCDCPASRRRFRNRPRCEFCPCGNPPARLETCRKCGMDNGFQEIPATDCKRLPAPAARCIIPMPKAKCQLVDRSPYRHRGRGQALGSASALHSKPHAHPRGKRRANGLGGSGDRP